MDNERGQKAFCVSLSRSPIVSMTATKTFNKLSVVSTFMSTLAIAFISKNDSYYRREVIDFISFKSPIKVKTKAYLKR